MTRSRLRRACASLLAITVLSAGCGLKEPQRQALETAGGGVVDPGTGEVVDPGTGTVDPGTGTVDPGTGTVDPGTGTVNPGTGTGTNPNPGTGTNPNPGTGTNPNPGTGGTVKGTTIGITKDTIKIGIHAPLTGASPVPSESFQKGARNFWIGKKVFGRTVEVEVLDDTYKPSGAVRQCQAMARRDFIVVGGAGTDQIQACGRDRTLQRTNTPYLSAGVTENGLQGVKTYFAISTSYADQAKLVIRSAEQQGFLKKGKWAVVLSNTPNFADAKAAITAELTAKGVENKYFPVPKAGSDSDAVELANNLRVYNAPVVFILGQPTFFLKVLNQTRSAYAPIWTGVGISFGINQVHGLACASTEQRYDGRFLSPYPGLDRAPAAFKESDGGRAKDDIELTLWGLSELLHQAMLRTNGALTRENFIAQLEKSSLPGGVYPSVSYTPGNHFGGTKMWQLKSACNGSASSQYTTVGNAPI